MALNNRETLVDCWGPTLVDVLKHAQPFFGLSDVDARLHLFHHSSAHFLESACEWKVYIQVMYFQSISNIYLPSSNLKKTHKDAGPNLSCAVGENENKPSNLNASRSPRRLMEVSAGLVAKIGREKRCTFLEENPRIFPPETMDSYYLDVHGSDRNDP